MHRTRSSHASRSIASVVAATLLVAGCSSTGGVTSSADKAASSATSKAKIADQNAAASKTTAMKPSKAASAKRTAQLRDAITLKGNDGVKVSVTPVKYVSKTEGSDEYTKPDKGKKYVAVQFRLKNVGTKPYDDSPSNGAKIIDNQGQQFDADFAESTAGPNLPASTKLTPGSTALGYLVFQLPKASKAVKVQFGMDSGFGETGEWLLH